MTEGLKATEESNRKETFILATRLDKFDHQASFIADHGQIMEKYRTLKYNLLILSYGDYAGNDSASYWEKCSNKLLREDWSVFRENLLEEDRQNNSEGPYNSAIINIRRQVQLPLQNSETDILMHSERNHIAHSPVSHILRQFQWYQLADQIGKDCENLPTTILQEHKEFQNTIESAIVNFYRHFENGVSSRIVPDHMKDSKFYSKCVCIYNYISECPHSDYSVILTCKCLV